MSAAFSILIHQNKTFREKVFLVDQLMQLEKPNKIFWYDPPFFGFEMEKVKK